MCDSGQTCQLLWCWLQKPTKKSGFCLGMKSPKKKRLLLILNNNVLATVGANLFVGANHSTSDCNNNKDLSHKLKHWRPQSRNNSSFNSPPQSHSVETRDVRLKQLPPPVQSQILDHGCSIQMWGSSGELAMFVLMFLYLHGAYPLRQHINSQSEQCFIIVTSLPTQITAWITSLETERLQIPHNSTT